jgi:hypothetical protein
MPLPALGALAARVAAGGGARAAGGRMAAGRGMSKSQIQMNQFERMIKAATKRFGDADKIKESDMGAATDTMAALVLARTARDVGVTLPKGQFSAAISKGVSHVKKRYTWRGVMKTGKNTGQLGAMYKHVAKSVFIGGKKFKVRHIPLYQKDGRWGMVQAGLAAIKKKAMVNVASSKASFYHLAKSIKLPTSGLKGGLFKDKGHLVKSLRSMGLGYRRLSKGKRLVMTTGNGANYGIQVETRADNSLNPHVRGISTFEKKHKGIKKEFGTLIRKGYIKEFKDVQKQFGVKNLDYASFSY